MHHFNFFTFENVYDKFDLISFNPPYVPEVKDNNIKYLINGSEKTLDLDINSYGPNKKSPISFLAIGDYFYVSKIDDKYYLM